MRTISAQEDVLSDRFATQEDDTDSDDGEDVKGRVLTTKENILSADAVQRYLEELASKVFCCIGIEKKKKRDAFYQLQADQVISVFVFLVKII